MIPYLYHFISTLLNANFDLNVSVANDITNEIAIDVAKRALRVKRCRDHPAWKCSL